MDEKLLRLAIREAIKACSIAEFGSPDYDWNINVDELVQKFRLRFDRHYPAIDAQGNPITGP